MKHALRRKVNAFKCGDNEAFKKWSNIVTEEITKKNEKLLIRLRKENSKEYWENMKSISGQKQVNKTNIDDNVTADTLNEFFLRYERDDSILLPETSLNSCDTPPTLGDSEVISLLKKSKNKRSKGSDGLSSGTLRNFRNVLVKPIKSILNTCLQEKRIPEFWKKVKITPIPKGNFSKITEPKQMRPVGQTPSMLKILEYYIRQCLSYMEPDLDENQFAYKKQASTGDAIALLTTLCSRSLDEPNTICRVLFLDYSSAFNTIHST
ncbi:Uncharacterised protein at_DN0214 [Pycnogonum litorale]